MMRFVQLTSLLLLVLVSCSKRKINRVSEDLQSNDWKIESLILNQQEQAGNFNGIEFEFTSNKTIQTYKTGLPDLLGSWNVSSENDQNNDGFLESKHLELSISLPETYASISDDWIITSYSENQITLKKGEFDQLILMPN